MGKKVFYAIVYIGLLTSCSNDFDLINQADPLPVVYFQMNPEDRYYYLTLTKSFAGDSSAYVMAHNPQAVYYDSAKVYLEAWIDEYKIWETQFVLTDRIKTPGIFAEVAGYCYKADALSLVCDLATQYRLFVNIPGMSKPVFSKIGIVGPPIIASRFDHQISLYPDRYKIGISPGPGSAYCELDCVFRYQQYEGIWVNHSDTFCLRQDINFEPGGTDYLYAELFFAKIATYIQPINGSIARRFTSLDLILYSADQYYRDYIDTYVNAGDHDVPPKGNIINGLGLFTMFRSAVKDNMTLDRVTYDSLCLGEMTKKLGFVRW